MTPPGDYADFRPWPWLFVYVRHLTEALHDGLRPPTTAKLAELCGVHRVTVFKALARADVRTWLAGRLGLDDDWKTRQILSRVAGQALAGSKDHQRLWLEVVGRLGPRLGEGGGGPKLGDGWSVTINVPMPPAASAAIDVPALPAGVGA